MLLDEEFEESHEFVVFQSFPNKQSAMDFISILIENDILYEYEEFFTIPSSTFITENESIKVIQVKIQQKDFRKVDQILTDMNQDEFNDLPAEYYLLSFGKDELLEVIEKSDEWSKFDYLLAIKLLKEKGVEVNETSINKMKEERLDSLSEPDKNQIFWIVLGYVSALLGGLFGVFIGYHLFTSKKVVPNGDKVFRYTATNRKHGQIIFGIGSVLFVIVLLLRILSEISKYS